MDTQEGATTRRGVIHAEGEAEEIKAELIEHTVYATRDAAIASIADYIEHFYNPQRRHSYLDYVSPIECELKATVAALAA